MGGAQPAALFGLLTAIGRSHGFPVDSHHPALELAELISLREQLKLQELGTAMGEWLFGPAAFNAARDPAGGLLTRSDRDAVERLSEPSLTVPRLLRLRHDEFPTWVDRMASETDWGRYRLVGFSSSFAQNAASFALAARIK